MGKRSAKFPKAKVLSEIRAVMAAGVAARPLPADADAVVRLKHALCAEFVKYKNRKRLTQKAMAEELAIDEALVSKIVHYFYDEFTVDRLVRYLAKLYPEVDIRLRVA